MDLRLDFALEGFRILKARPKLVLIWGAVSLFGYGLCILLFIAIFGPWQPQMLALQTRPDNAAIVATVAPALLTALAVCAPIYLLTSSILHCAVCRAGLGEGDDRLGFLMFGVREFQIMVVSLVSLILISGLFVLIIMAWSVVRLPQTLATLAALTGALAAAWLKVRLSLNIPQSFAMRRIEIFGSFGLTRDHFWRLAGGYLLAFGLSLAVVYLCDQIIGAILLVGFGEPPGKASFNLSSLPAFLTPPRIAILAMTCGLVAPQTAAILYGPSVAAYGSLARAVQRTAEGGVSR